jgi:23S rRNA (cytosine1962-C5)-methyltransferase
MAAQVTLIPKREKSILRKHPWIYSKAIKKIKGVVGIGDLVDVYASDGKWLARGSYSPDSQIRIRIWTYNAKEQIDQDFFDRRIERAKRVREDMVERQGLTGYRLAAAESDGLPGITIDKYDQILVCQFLSAGAERFKGNIVEALNKHFPKHVVYERSDVDVRKKEGLELTTGLLSGNLESTATVIDENGLKIHVDVKQGHKTGFYLDQRDSRAALEKYVEGKSVLNCFCYTGTFSLYALRGNAASVTNVDVSGPALDTAKRNIELNELDLSKVNFEQEDVFKLLRQYRDEGKKFDVIVLDPPKFVDSKANLTSACRGYKDINMIAMQIINPGGYLLTFSCSGLMETGLFHKVVADAALDAHKDVYFVERLAQAQDHPIASFYPEGFYLKGLVCKVF